MPADDLAAAVFRNLMRGSAETFIRGTPDLSTAMAVATPVKPGKARRKVAMPASRTNPALLQSYQSQSGQSIQSLSEEKPLLLVFLRHFG